MESATMVGAPAAGAAGRGSDIGRLVRRAALEDAPLLALVVAYATSAVLLSRTIGIPDGFELAFSPGRWTLAGASTFVVGFVLFFGILAHEVTRRKNSIREMGTWRNVLHRVFPARKTLNYAFIFLVLPTFTATFTAFKISIIEFVPFGPWDIRFAEWDRLLHFGMYPHELLAPLIGHPIATKALDLAYLAWFPVIWFSLVWQAWHGSRGSATRSQFLLAFALCWILLGTVAATAFSSAGPVYFSRVTDVGMDPYAGLLEHLTAVNEQFGITALTGHDMLWQSHVNDDPTQFSGISAMPSLHVSICSLLAILGFEVDRRVGWLYAIFAALIFLGSIQLAWHYAIDGYVAVLGTAGIWWLSGKIVGSWRARVGLQPTPA